MASGSEEAFAAAVAGHGDRDDAFVIRVWRALTRVELPAKE